MTKYIAFLRGINVGNIRIKMPDLKAAFETLGFLNVKTYLQTGNVVFESAHSLQDIKPILEQNLTQTFHYEAFVLLYNFDLLPQVIEQYPFSREETHHAYVIFIDNEAIKNELLMFGSNEGVVAGRNVLYWKVLRGDTLETPFAKVLAKAKYKANTTVRNINTLEKML